MYIVHEAMRVDNTIVAISILWTAFNIPARICDPECVAWYHPYSKSVRMYIRVVVEVLDDVFDIEEVIFTHMAGYKN